VITCWLAAANGHSVAVHDSMSSTADYRSSFHQR